MRQDQSGCSVIVPDSLAVLPCSDPVWSFNGTNCSSFAISPGVEQCEQHWATGTDENGATVTAYVACEISCGSGGAARECISPELAAPEPEPEPVPESEPEPEPEPDLCAE